VVLGVNTAEQGDPAPKARQFRDQHKLTYPVLVDAGDKVAQKYGVMAFPTNVIIDRKGVVRVVETGFNPGSLGQTIENLLK
jgi:cytochrome c biogenesis protein CcmG/thiol:disulfide interchange protein DsbE